MILSKLINTLRVNSLFLFLIPSIAIIGSLLIHNFLVDFKYTLLTKSSHLSDVVGEEYTVDCTEDNSYCMVSLGIGDIHHVAKRKKHEAHLPRKKDEAHLPIYGKKIDDCFINSVNSVFLNNGKEYPVIEDFLPSALYIVEGKGANAKVGLKKEFKNSKIELKQYVTDKKDEQCIKNDQIYYFFYKYFPPYSYIVDQKIKGINLGTGASVNPFLYGEVSISNLVKRHPINYFFKFFLYIGIILMIMYWYNYNKIFKIILNKKINIFYFFGLGSAIFLFFHVYFLGTNSNNEFLKDFRKSVIILFILFEVIAQTFLAMKIYKHKDIFTKYCYKLIVLSKVFFVSFILIFTVCVIIILYNYNVPSNVEYILEWNYFIALLLFYLLSYLMWKKKS
jgi:hypothetical protein